MIKIAKGQEPKTLSKDKKKWTKELLAHINADRKIPKPLRDKYNSKTVKNALKTECKSKCMYCESKVSHIAYEHIEHIKPKAPKKYPQLTFEYKNLGLSCPVCNVNKGDNFDPVVPYINPYSDDPSMHFHCYGSFIWANEGDARARITELDIKLNRPALLERRGERIEVIKNLISTYNLTPIGALKDALKKQIEIEIDSEKEFSFCSKKLAKELMN